MKLTKQRKLYVGILGLAGAGLVADRVFLGGGTNPGGAKAAAASLLVVPEGNSPGAAPAHAPAPAAATAANTAPTGAISAARAVLADRRVETVGDRVRELTLGESDGNGADAFVIPDSWGDPLGKPAAQAEVRKLDATQFKLKAILTNRASGALVAAINGKAYTAGESIGEVQVQRVEKDAVTLRAPTGETLTLRLETAIAKDAITPAPGRTGR